MKAGLVVLGVVALIALGVGGWVVGSYNKLVAKKADVDNAYHQVDNELLRRNDVVPELVGTVKGVAAQEQIVFGQVDAARAAMAGASTPQQKFAAGNQMDGVLGRLLAVVENYPQIKSQENFLKLQDQLEGTENRLVVARKRYNDVATEYNVMVRVFPTNLFAGMLNFKDQPLWEVAPEAKQAPKVEFPAAPSAQPAPSSGATNTQPAPAAGATGH